MKKKYAITILMLISSLVLQAQSTEDAVQLDTAQKQIQITASLSGYGNMQITFARIEDWQGVQELKRIAMLAADHYEHLKDSFKEDYSGKTLYIKLPVHEDVSRISFRENFRDAHNMAFKDGNYYQLKTVKDSIVVLKDQATYFKGVLLSNDSVQRVQQVQYVFAINNLSDLTKILASDILDDVGTKIDSILKKYKAKWNKRNDSRNLNINIQNENTVVISYTPLLGNHILGNMAFGLQLINKQVAVPIDVGIGYIKNKKNKNSLFAIAVLSTYYLGAIPISESTFYYAIGVEVGSMDYTAGTTQNKVSIGVNYFIGNPDWGNYKKNPIKNTLPNMIKLNLNYPVYKNINVGLDLYSNFKFNDDHAGLIGLFVKYNL